jgi:hypothetical protein
LDVVPSDTVDCGDCDDRFATAAVVSAQRPSATPVEIEADPRDLAVAKVEDRSRRRIDSHTAVLSTVKALLG